MKMNRGLLDDLGALFTKHTSYGNYRHVMDIINASNVKTEGC